MSDYNGMIDYNGWIEVDMHIDPDDVSLDDSDLKRFLEEIKQGKRI